MSPIPEPRQDAHPILGPGREAFDIARRRRAAEARWENEGGSVAPRAWART